METRLPIVPPKSITRPVVRERFALARHARYAERGVVYHIISRTRGNLFLLRPDRAGLQRKIVAGVLAEAKRNWPHIANYATAILSNHLHALLSPLAGDPRDLADYIRFVKSEITRRWSEHVGWSGSIWGGYQATAIITPAAQLRALRYVLAQGAKENLVADPRDWPGFHCASSLAGGEAVEGHWFDGTGYGKARHAEKMKVRPKALRRESFLHQRLFSFDRLPALSHLSDKDHRVRIKRMVESIVSEREAEFNGRPPLGPEAICDESPRDSRPVPKPPWFEERRRMIVWDDIEAPEVRTYLKRYWLQQRRFRAASAEWQREGFDGNFPELCFIPGSRSRPIAHMEQSSA